MESLFLNSVTYENEMLDAYMRQAHRRQEEGARPARGEVAVMRTRCSWPSCCCALALRRRRAGAKPRRRRRRRASRWSPPSFDFGKVLPDKTLQKSSSIRNFGSADLVIESVSTTCGCTVALDGLREDA